MWEGEGPLQQHCNTVRNQRGQKGKQERKSQTGGGGGVWEGEGPLQQHCNTVRNQRKRCVIHSVLFFGGGGGNISLGGKHFIGEGKYFVVRGEGTYYVWGGGGGNKQNIPWSPDSPIKVFSNYFSQSCS